MDDIQTRLQETSKNCFEAYTVWVEKKKDTKAQEALGSAIHELRKVSSRLEIELALSERDQMTSKPLPIPAHRANSKKAAGGNKGDKKSGNGPAADAQDGGAPVVQQKRRPRRKPEGDASQASEG